MPRRPRSSLPPFGYFHVTSRGVDRMDIFRSDDDRRLLVAWLLRISSLRSWVCHVYCLMGNHYHLVVESKLDDLSRGMQRLNGLHARAFNDRYGRVGHLFQDRYDARLIEGDGDLERACTYVLANPVRAGLCADPAQWRWSGGTVAERLFAGRQWLKGS